MGDAQQLRLLHVSGDEVGRQAVTRMLQQAGYVVTEAHTGAEALEGAAADPPDLFLVSTPLSDLTGAELCRRLKADPATAPLPVLHLSRAAALPEDLEGGADAYLVEPVTPAALLGTVRALLRAQQAEQALRESQALLRTVVEEIPDPIYVKDRESRILLANAALAKVVGRPLEEILGKTDTEYYNDAAAGMTLRIHDLRVMAAGASETMEETVPTPLGPRTFLSTKVPYRDAAGRTVGIIGISRDITAQLLAEQALRGNEARLRLLAEAMPHMVWSADQSGNIDYFNQRAYAYGGAPSGGARDWHLSPIVHPEDKARTYWAWRRAFRRGQAYEIEHRLRRRDGAYRWHLTRGLPVRGEDGVILRWIGTATDIHAQKLAERALRESETRYRRLFDTMQEGMATIAVVTDAQGRPVDCRFLEVNPTMERYHGGTREQMVGRTYRELVPNPDPEWIAIVGGVALTGRPASGERYAPVTGRWLRYHAYSPQPGQCAMVFEDITARKQAEAERERLHHELARQALLLDTIVSTTDSRLAYLDRDLRYVRVNAAYAANAQMTPEEFVGRHQLEVFPNAPEVAALYRRVLDTGQPSAIEEYTAVPRYRPEAGPRTVRVGAVPVKDAAGEVVGVVTSQVDVSEEVRVRERAVAAERARAELAEHLSDEIAHRVKNNLAMISGLLQMQVLSEADPQVEMALRDAVSRVRTFANLHEQMYAQHHETVDLLEAIERIAESTRSVCSPREEVEIRVQGERVVCAARDATNLCVITNELLTNALKHGGPGPHGRLHIEVGLTSTEGQVCLSVWNSGPPIAGGFRPGAQQSMGLRLVWDLVVDQYGGSFALQPERGGTLATARVAAVAVEED